jgi:RNA polymerase sigma-70 factor (ECF subfamily)
MVMLACCPTPPRMDSPPEGPLVVPSEEPLGSPEFGAIYEEHAKPVFYLALRMLGDAARAEDATHDVFLKAFRSHSQFRGESSVRTWLYRIALNHCRNILASWHQRTMVTNQEEGFWEDSSPHAETPLRALENSELGRRIERTLQALPEEYRTILLLVADAKLSYEEVGELTGQTGDAVRGKLHRARKAFAAHFHKNETV